MAAANASQKAKNIANSLKKQLMNVTNTTNKPKKAFNIMRKQIVQPGGFYINSMKQENINRAYTNLIKNGSLTPAQKNVLKRAYFAYKNRPESGKNRPKINMNLTGVNNYNAYKKRLERSNVKASANAGRKNLNTGNMGTGNMFK